MYNIEIWLWIGLSVLGLSPLLLLIGKGGKSITKGSPIKYMPGDESNKFYGGSDPGD